MKTRHRTAAEIIAFHLCTDIRDVQEQRYQPTRNVSPAVYNIGDFYFCCPTAGQSCPSGYYWHTAGQYYGRTVYRTHMNDDLVED